MVILRVSHLNKVYGSRFGSKTQALSDLSFEAEKGEFIAIMGESGSGKSTLLNIISTLDHEYDGEVVLNGKNLAELRDRDLADFRRDRLGFVFQDFNLLDNQNNEDNIYLPLVLGRCSHSEMRERLHRIEGILGIREILKKFPYESSGGQKQRVAIARAIITKPELLLADEPTGALDSRSANVVMKIFEEIHALGQTILMVTHSIKAAAHASRVLFIKDGQLFHEIYRAGASYADFAERIAQVQTLVLNKEG